MDKTALIDAILEKEWPMFHNVNGAERADCQNDFPVFQIMRRAQYKAWSDAALEAYLADITAAEAEGRNLAREKYIRMMESTDPRGYEHFSGELPPVSEEKRALCEAIWAKMLVQTERMRETYPILALGGRPLHASEERDGWASIETYQTSELNTYSEETLEKLLAHIKDMQAKGEDFVYKIQENSVTCLGYKDMREAEIAMMGQVMGDLGITVEPDCPTCMIPDDVQ
jgi:hypothetical protein